VLLPLPLPLPLPLDDTCVSVSGSLQNKQTLSGMSGIFPSPSPSPPLAI
jgi:hypothetical protein